MFRFRRDKQVLTAKTEEPVITENTDPSLWWGRFALEEGQARRWKLGPSTLVVLRLKQEWRIVHHQKDDPNDNSLDIAATVPVEELGSGTTVRRYMFRQTSKWLTLTPVLADRPMIMRPETSFMVQDTQEVTLYVSSALWIRVGVADSPVPLREVASLRPSDTWFGETTTAGELCYASKIAARLMLEELPKRPYRAISPIRIRNVSRKPLLIERIRLPVEVLSLYKAQDNYLWTNGLTLIQERDGTRVELGRNAPPEIGRAVRVGGPREVNTRNRAIRVFGRLFKEARGEDR